jgi:hypothetical protein
VYFPTGLGKVNQRIKGKRRAGENRSWNERWGRSKQRKRKTRGEQIGEKREERAKMRKRENMEVESKSREERE